MMAQKDERRQPPVDTQGCYDMDFDFKLFEFSKKQIITGVVIGAAVLGLGFYLYHRYQKKHQ